MLIPNSGGMPEIVTHGVDGFLCSTPNEFIEAIKNIEQLDLSKTREQVLHKYEPEAVATGFTRLFLNVSQGLRWQ